jgi:hypothetical protein
MFSPDGTTRFARITGIFAKGLSGQVERGQRIFSYEVIGHSIRDGSLTQVNETVFHARRASG